MKPWVKVAAPDIPIPTRDRPTDTDRPTILSFFCKALPLSLFPFPVVAKKGVGKPRVVGLFHPCYCEGFCWGGRNGARPSKEEAIIFFFLLLLVLLLSIASSPRATGGHEESFARKKTSVVANSEIVLSVANISWANIVLQFDQNKINLSETWRF